jgi:hypothetical protein
MKIESEADLEAAHTAFNSHKAAVKALAEFEAAMTVTGFIMTADTRSSMWIYRISPDDPSFETLLSAIEAGLINKVEATTRALLDLGLNVPEIKSLPLRHEVDAELKRVMTS